MNQVMNVVKTQTMSSLEISKLTGKRHDNVMRDIRSMLSDLEQSSNLSFVCKSTTYEAISGQKYPQYELDKDTTLTLLLGYDAVARMKVVKRWQELEEQNQKPQLPQTYLEALKQLVVVTEDKIALEQKVAEDAPKVIFTDSITSCDTSISVERFAKLYKPVTLGRNKMFALLRELGILRGNNLPYQQYMHHFELREFVTNFGHIRTQTLINTRGQVYLANRLDRYFKEREVALNEPQV